jgi:Ni,Fe-hydrogenase III large subunit/Ni,Fe-hydrogenase III component G
MRDISFIQNILASEKIDIFDLSRPFSDETYITVAASDFAKVCTLLHDHLNSPVMMFFAEDLRERSGSFALYCVFLSMQMQSWVFLRQNVDGNRPEFASLAKNIYSASLFEREIKEMFGVEPLGNPDQRSLKLHCEVWPAGRYPLRKDFTSPREKTSEGARYLFKRVEGEGIFEVPVGPVHAGIIGPGHFRFSSAGEPIINLELRLGWTHRGIEKLLEGKSVPEAVKIFECISGDTAFGYSMAFCRAVEKVQGVDIPLRSQLIRVLCLELERLYNHANDMGGIALDVGFSFPAQFASLIKEAILQLNDAVCGSRYLKGVNTVGGTLLDIDTVRSALIRTALTKIRKDFCALEEMLFSSVSFMDRADATGILHTKTARDLGITGLAARASGVGLDMRKVFPDIYHGLSFKTAKEQAGDVAARLKVRCSEVTESLELIHQCLEKLATCDSKTKIVTTEKNGVALGYVEAWRGPVLVWARFGSSGHIERCKIVDPSFHNWEGLSYAVLGNIIPDFPLCNKSFDLSYSGNDL